MISITKKRGCCEKQKKYVNVKSMIVDVERKPHPISSIDGMNHRIN